MQHFFYKKHLSMFSTTTVVQTKISTSRVRSNYILHHCTQSGDVDADLSHHIRMPTECSENI